MQVRMRVSRVFVSRGFAAVFSLAVSFASMLRMPSLTVLPCLRAIAMASYGFFVEADDFGGHDACTVFCVRGYMLQFVTGVLPICYNL